MAELIQELAMPERGLVAELVRFIWNVAAPDAWTMDGFQARSDMNEFYSVANKIRELDGLPVKIEVLLGCAGQLIQLQWPQGGD